MRQPTVSPDVGELVTYGLEPDYEKAYAIEAYTLKASLVVKRRADAGLQLEYELSL